MSAIESAPLAFNVANAATRYVDLPIPSSKLHSVQIAWLDAISSATITIESTNRTPNDASFDSTNAALWSADATSITGPNGTAIGSVMVNLADKGFRRARLKIIASAASKFVVTPHGKG